MDSVRAKQVKLADKMICNDLKNNPCLYCATQAVQVLSKAKVTESSSRKRMTLLDDVDSHKFDALL